MKRKLNFEDKPYNRCLFCQKRRSDPPQCNGPRTASMTTERWREFMRDLKSVDDITYDELSERTGGQLSAASIQNSLAPGAAGDMTREKARLIENAIFGITVAPPCPFEFLGSIDAAGQRVFEVEKEMAELRKNISAIHDSYNMELDIVRRECQKKLDHMQNEMDFLKKELAFKSSVIDRLLGK